MTTEQTHDAILRLRGGYDSGHGLRLEGEIYGDKLTTGNHPFPDGTAVSTSPVAHINGPIFTTRSGTRYLIEFDAISQANARVKAAEEGCGT